MKRYDLPFTETGSGVQLMALMESRWPVSIANPLSFVDLFGDLSKEYTLYAPYPGAL